MKVVHIETVEPYGYAKWGECFSTEAPVSVKKQWLSTREIYIAKLNCAERLMTPVMLEREKNLTYLMDIITGTLYDLTTKRCLSSDVVKLISYKKDPADGKAALKIKTNG